MDAVFQIETYDSFKKVSNEILNNLHKSSQKTDTEIDSNGIDAAKEYMRKLIVKHNFNIEEVAKYLENQDWKAERIEYLTAWLQKNKSKVLQSIIKHHNMAYADTLVDYNWVLKLILGSSQFKGLKYPLLQLILSSINTNGEQKQRLYELNKESLFKLITMLEDYQ